MKVFLLVIPEEPDVSRNVRPKTVFPIETAQAAALLSNAGHEVFFLDLNILLPELWLSEVEKSLLCFRPDVLAATPQFLTFNIREARCIIKEAFELAQRINPKIVTVYTGAYATSFPDRALAEAKSTYVLRGEFELSLMRLVELVGRGVYEEFDGWEGHISPHETALDLKILPFPAYEICNYTRYFEKPEKGNLRYPERSRRFTSYQATRGCTCGCSFCNVSFLRGKRRHRCRSVDQVLNHLKYLSSNMGIEEVHFVDENLTLNRKFALDLFRGIKEFGLSLSWIPAAGISVYTLDQELLEAMDASGCYRLTLAFESGSQKILNQQIGKPIHLDRDIKRLQIAHEMGFETIGYFVLGFPGETKEQIRETIVLAERPEFDYVVFSIATPQKGTVLFEKCTEAHLLDENVDIAGLSRRNQASFDTDAFTRYELQEIRVREWDRINFSSSEKRQVICRMMGLTDRELDVMRQKTLSSL